MDKISKIKCKKDFLFPVDRNTWVRKILHKCYDIDNKFEKSKLIKIITFPVEAFIIIFLYRFVEKDLIIYKKDRFYYSYINKRNKIVVIGEEIKSNDILFSFYHMGGPDKPKNSLVFESELNEKDKKMFKKRTKKLNKLDEI